MPIEPAARMAHIGQETAFEVLVRARALEATGRSVIHLEIGEPDFDTPGHIVQAGQQALEAGMTHYGPARSPRAAPGGRPLPGHAGAACRSTRSGSW